MEKGYTMNLAYEDVVRVLSGEVDNPDNVHLYLEGDVWCAYERSAYYLIKLHAPVVLQKAVIGGSYDIVLMKVLFRMDDLRLPLSPAAKLKWVSDDKLEFKLKTEIEGFSEWKSSQLRYLSA